jgi:hypothetical protein
LITILNIKSHFIVVLVCLFILLFYFFFLRNFIKTVASYIISFYWKKKIYCIFFIKLLSFFFCLKIIKTEDRRFILDTSVSCHLKNNNICGIFIIKYPNNSHQLSKFLINLLAQWIIKTIEDQKIISKK